jgi:hypothetical protein
MSLLYFGDVVCFLLFAFCCFLSKLLVLLLLFLDLTVYRYEKRFEIGRRVFDRLMQYHNKKKRFSFVYVYRTILHINGSATAVHLLDFLDNGNNLKVHLHKIFLFSFFALIEHILYRPNNKDFACFRFCS